MKEKGNTSLSSLFVSEMLERRKLENAIKLYQKAKNIYEELGRKQEVAYLKKRLKDLQ